MKNKKFIRAILTVAVIAGVWFFSVNKQGRHNVIFISLDTMRADHLGCYGYGSNTTPNIDKFASENILFENVIAPAPMTFPSHSSVFTGTNPVYHGVHNNVDEHFDDYNVTLAETLKDAGYKTCAVVSSFVLDSKNGIGQGFDDYLNHNEQTTGLAGPELAAGRRAQEATKQASDWLDKNSKDRFFLFVHYFDPHFPYAPPEPFAGEYADNLYAGEIAYMDKSIGTFFDKLKSLGLYDDTVIVVFGDHGEMLGEHGETEHSFYVYESAVKVPMIIKPAGNVNPVRVKEQVGLIDIAPTVYSILGIKPRDVFHGEDISRFFDGVTVRQEKRYYYIESLTPKIFECNSLLGVIERDWKYIQTTRPELYNVANDRAEVNNLVEQESRRARLMKGKLQVIVEEQVYKSETTKQKEYDAESIEQLASLGYIGGGIEETFDFDQSKFDPKDMVEVFEKFKIASKCYAKQDFDKALVLSREIQEEFPTIIPAHDLTANIAFHKGDMETAIVNYLKALELRPQSVPLLEKVAFSYQKNKQFEESSVIWKKLLVLAPDNLNALNNYGTDMIKLENRKPAIESWEKSVEINPAQPEIHNKLAMMYYVDGDFERVASHWKEAIKYKPDWAKVLNDLAWIYATEKESKIYNPQEAVELALLACKLTFDAKPGYLDTLSVAYAEIGSYNEAVIYGEKAIGFFLSSDNTEQADEIKERIKKYKQK